MTERRSADGQRQWTVPGVVCAQGEQARSEIVHVTVRQDEPPLV